MSWSKLKTIIILILIFLNLFLLALVGVNQINSARYRATALSEAAAVLELNGIQVERERLPASMELSAALVARDTGREARLAALLLGEDVESRSAGGGLLFYESAAGSVSFRGNGEFSASFTRPVPVSQGEPAEHARSVLERLGLELWQLTESPAASGTSLTAVQALNGAPVFSSGIAASASSAAGVTFTYDGEGRLTSAAGRLLLGAVTSDPDAQTPLDVPTALISFFNFIVENGDVCQAIRALTPVYRSSTMSDTVRLSSAWRITTDTGDYFLDAVTAEVTRALPE